MTNKEKLGWLTTEILLAELQENHTNFISLVCPWGAKYKIVNSKESFARFRKKLKQCYGFKDHRSGPNRLGIKSCTP